MNKKVVLSLITIPFVLASCHGQTVSRADALKILDGMEEANSADNLPFSVFTLLVTTDEENNKSESKYFYSIPDRYYHAYTTLNGAVSEEWSYVKSDEEGVDHIYNVNRIIDSSINEETSPKYATEVLDFEEEDWEEKHNHYSRILLKETMTLISALKVYLDSEPGEGSTLTLESYGSGDLYAKRTVVDSEKKVTYEKEVEFASNCLVKYVYKSTSPQERNRTYSVSYASAEIFYPKTEE